MGKKNAANARSVESNGRSVSAPKTDGEKLLGGNSIMVPATYIEQLKLSVDEADNEVKRVKDKCNKDITALEVCLCKYFYLNCSLQN